MVKTRKQRSKIALFPKDEEVKSARRKLPVFDPHDLRSLITEAKTNDKADVDAAILFAFRNHLPAVYAFRFFTEVGGLLSYGEDLTDNFRSAATYADRILKGAKPSGLPVQAPVKFELVINLKAAKALSLTIPQTLLVAADKVIE
jgi:ABC-type uncharacterized transport system substrate-binding protein